MFILAFCVGVTVAMGALTLFVGEDQSVRLLGAALMVAGLAAALIAFLGSR